MCKTQIKKLQLVVHVYALIINFIQGFHNFEKTGKVMEFHFKIQCLEYSWHFVFGHEKMCLGLEK